MPFPVQRPARIFISVNRQQETSYLNEAKRMMAQPATPFLASTVVLVRSDQAGGFEIFMNRRPDNMDVYAGIYVFPGGRVEAADCTPVMLNLTEGLTPAEAQRILGGELEADLCLGHWVAAVRELFEEVGIHFFVPQNGALSAAAHETLSQRLAEKRAGLQQGTIDFASLLAAEGLWCNLAPLTYFFHRVTPAHNPYASIRGFTSRRYHSGKPRWSVRRKSWRVFGFQLRQRWRDPNRATFP